MVKLANTPDLHSRAIGTFIGLVVGDALGTTLEFSSRDAHTVTEMVGGGPFDLLPGGWTDDSSMAIAIGESLAQEREWNPIRTMEEFILWAEEGKYSHTGDCFDIGRATYAALDRYVRDPISPYCGSTAEQSAGNGSIMRLAPIFTFYAVKSLRDSGKSVAIDQSLLTHAHPDCLKYCGKCADVVYTAFEGKRHPDLEKFGARDRSEVDSSGYVVATYEAACWAVGSTDNFRDAVLAAVNLGGDADTVGAVAGMFAGALYGWDSIPKGWRESIQWSNCIHDLAERLWRKS